MDQISHETHAPGRRLPASDGFTLIEVMIAMLVLTVGVLSLVGVMGLGLQTAASSSPMLIAREKAREAVESVHSARDTGELAWSRARNVANGGIFLDDMQDIKTPGADGLVGTGDTGEVIEVVRAPGPDGKLETGDDLVTSLGPELFKRQIAITSLNYDGTTNVNPNLRQVVVTVKYRVLGVWRTYTLTTLLSSYS
jgi:prepilin-type N-terminal cleavage/methylation domain-containing protein